MKIQNLARENYFRTLLQKNNKATRLPRFFTVVVISKPFDASDILTYSDKTII